jgi:pimeloyl-ACP methyl ester carboxylesterase
MNDVSPPLAPQRIEVSGHEGVPLNVWDYGGAGPPLLLCHCTGAAGRVWDPVAARLIERFRLFAVDARGHGESGKPAQRSAYEWIHNGHDLLAVIDQLALGPGAWAAGHSGGGAGIAYAEMLRPGTFSRVVLIDAIIGPRAVFSGERPLAAKARRRKAVFESREAARQRFAAKPPMDAWSAEALDAFITHGLSENPDGSVALKCPPEIEAWMYEFGGACDVFDRLGELDFEALLVTGSNSEIAPFAEAQNARLPHARLEVIPDTGHFIPQQRPKEMADLLSRWFLEPGGEYY